jgi:AcrR family transcriptional regulator
MSLNEQYNEFSDADWDTDRIKGEPKMTVTKEQTIPSTATSILDALREAAFVAGLDGVSMRDVATRAGISLASLQYHYPNKDALLAAFVERTISIHRARIEQIHYSVDGASLVRAALRYAAEETLRIADDPVLSMIEARVARDETARRCFEELMDSYMQLLTELISQAAPGLPEQQVRTTALLICSLLEGLPLAMRAAKLINVAPECVFESVLSLAVKCVNN